MFNVSDTTHFEVCKGTIALMLAAWMGHLDAVMMLLAIPNIDPNVADNNGDTAMKMIVLEYIAVSSPHPKNKMWCDLLSA